MCVNVSTDGNQNYANAANDLLKSAAISREASSITHNRNILSLEIGNIRKSSQSPSTYVAIRAYMYYIATTYILLLIKYILLQSF